jgi:hypothetical protein
VEGRQVLEEHGDNDVLHWYGDINKFAEADTTNPLPTEQEARAEAFVKVLYDPAVFLAAILKRTQELDVARGRQTYEQRDAVVSFVLRDFFALIDERPSSPNENPNVLMAIRMSDILRACDSLIEQLTKHAPSPRTATYIASINAAKHAFAQMAPNLTINNCCTLINDGDITLIRLASSEFTAFRDITEEELQSLKKAVGNLSQTILKKMEDGPLRRWLLGLCLEMERAIAEFVIFGAESFAKHYTAVVGELTSRGRYFNDDASKNCPDEVKSWLAIAWEAFDSIARRIEPSLKLAAVTGQLMLLATGNHPPTLPPASTADH